MSLQVMSRCDFLAVGPALCIIKLKFPHLNVEGLSTAKRSTTGRLAANLHNLRLSSSAGVDNCRRWYIYARRRNLLMMHDADGVSDNRIREVKMKWTILRICLLFGLMPVAGQHIVAQTNLSLSLSLSLSRPRHEDWPHHGRRHSILLLSLVLSTVKQLTLR